MRRTYNTESMDRSASIRSHSNHRGGSGFVERDPTPTMEWFLTLNGWSSCHDNLPIIVGIGSRV